MNIKNIVPDGLKGVQNVDSVVQKFVQEFKPLEANDVFHVLVDARTNARYCECHIQANKLVPLSTTDVPLDPEDQPEYRANREIVTSHMAFERMQQDAKQRRSFSNLVAEFTVEYDADHPLKIIGGQHRYQAIKEAFEAGVDEFHGVKVYFGLDLEQRLDVQLISNTVIAVSADLYDRMQETVRGPELRNWCHKVGLLASDQDFADKRQRGAPITVKTARTFIMNYYAGLDAGHSDFEKTDTTPSIAKSGEDDLQWEAVRSRKPSVWKDAKLEKAGAEFSALIKAQREAFKGSKGNADSQEKAMNYAVLSAWAYVAGLLSGNEKRQQRHYQLKLTKGKDPLNAAALAKGRHKTDSDNYRGLGYRTDAKERGRFVELFNAHAEKGEGINTPLINIAIAKYHAKQATLDVEKAEKAGE
ncbi:MAG: hypothetical protein ACYDCG_00675 [Candidatus Acidiferrales bacterium]